MRLLSNGPLHSKGSNVGGVAAASVSKQVTIKKWGPSLPAALAGMALLFILSAFIFVESAVTADAREVAVIAGKSFPVDSVTLDTLQAIYNGEKQIIAGVRLKPIDQRDNQQIKSLFLDRVLDLTRIGYATYWNNRLFREGGIPPALKNNPQEVIEAVEDTSGAIGYVWLEEAKAAKEHVKILLTINVGQ